MNTEKFMPTGTKGWPCMYLTWTLVDTSLTTYKILTSLNLLSSGVSLPGSGSYTWFQLKNYLIEQFLFFAFHWCIFLFVIHPLKPLKNYVSIFCFLSPLDRRAPHGSVRKSCILHVCGGPSLSTHSGIQQPKIVHQATPNLVAEQSIAYMSVWGVGKGPPKSDHKLDQVYCAWLNKGVLCLYILKKAEIWSGDTYP